MGSLDIPAESVEPTTVYEVTAFELGYSPALREVVLCYHCDNTQSFTVLVPDGMAMQMVAQFLKKRLFCLH